MKDKKMLAVLSVVFVLLLGGAGILYSRLSKTVEHQGLTVQETAVQAQMDAEDGKTDGAGRAGESEVEQQGSSRQAQSSGQPDEPEETDVDERPPAPDFTVTDRNGNTVSLSDFVGKPVVLNFWASWCGPCKSEMPDFDAAYEEYGEEIHFVMVNLTDGFRETTDTAQKFVDQQGYQFPIYFDTESSAAIAYSVTSIPATYFIDADGKPVAQGRGALDGETLQKGISMILPQ